MREIQPSIYTDLALEARELATAGTGELPGVSSETLRSGPLQITRLCIRTAEGAQAMQRSPGAYTTVELPEELSEGDDLYAEAVEAIADLIRTLLPSDCAPVLVAGLGNELVTPDAFGPVVARQVLVTRHLVEGGYAQFPELFRPVAAMCPGVLGQTGVESAEMILGVVKTVRPCAVIAVDALAARRLDRLGRTLQITDTGILPGGGIGNHRQEITEHTMGVPVIGIGTPTVISAATLINDVLEEALPQPSCRLPLGRYAELYVAPKEIDEQNRRVGRLLGYAINIALQKDLTIEDVRYYGQ
ncbi:MAG: GPR endopeptidase [Clostridiales bacterium]|nr:GPR endopeptidase [Clostridiales bacterium]